MNKVVKSAVVVIPPPGVWDQIQRIRAVHDKSYERWMPHINLLYPFAPDTNFEALTGRAISALKDLQPFRLRLSEFGFFQHSPKSATVWLRPDADSHPEIAQDLLTLQAKLEQEFPECNDLSNLSGSFKPHLTVGQFREQNKLKQGISSFQSGWTPIEFEVNCVYFISRTANDPFAVRKVIPLGNSNAAGDFEALPIPKQGPAAGQVDLFLGNLPFNVTEQQIRAALEPHLQVVSINLVKKQGRPAGFGFATVQGSNPSQLVNSLPTIVVNGRAINVAPPKQR